MTIVLDRKEVASFKRWQSVEIVPEELDDPTPIDKKLNLLDMRLTQLSREMRRLQSDEGATPSGPSSSYIPIFSLEDFEHAPIHTELSAEETDE